MTKGWGPAVLLLALSTLAAAACPKGLVVVRVANGTVLAAAQAAAFSLSYRHSVTLTPVTARYVIAGDGRLIQVEERFSAHGPGLAHDVEGWRREGDSFVLTLEREIDRLVLRTAPEYENLLIADGARIDLTAWPREPLEVRAIDCKETSE